MRTQTEIIERAGWALALVHPTADDSNDGGPLDYTAGLTAHRYPELLVAGIRGAPKAEEPDVGVRVVGQASTSKSGLTWSVGFGGASGSTRTDAHLGLHVTGAILIG
ncbi:hypothetical protein [Micromonospora maritima]|uniref:hypothetical protein n=1 Tax=Micromonospora maritima TaxID=986711 RepID=UPI00157BF8B8|nr:hypothetical protein [Micromonospora maritima]